jgi:hypothetical protein
VENVIDADLKFILLIQQLKKKRISKNSHCFLSFYKAHTHNGWVFPLPKKLFKPHYLFFFSMVQILQLKTQRDIREMSRMGYSARQIAKTIRCGREQALKYSKMSKGIKKRKIMKKLGRKPILKNSLVSRVAKKLKTKTYSSVHGLKSDIKIKMCDETARKLLKKAGGKFYIPREKPRLYVGDKEKRMSWVEGHVTDKKAWRMKIFADEKKFTCHAPDGMRKRWIGKEKSNEVDRIPKNYRGAVHVWCAFGHQFKPPLVRYSECFTGKSYVEFLEANLLPYARERYGEEIVFQEDNAPCHNAEVVKKWKLREGITNDSQPASSPDLNPTENVWTEISRRVYQGGKNYENENKLWDAILASYNEIEDSFFTALCDSMTKRCLEVIKVGGDSICY